MLVKGEDEEAPSGDANRVSVIDGQSDKCGSVVRVRLIQGLVNAGSKASIVSSRIIVMY